jgi:hypothetical protein
MVENHIPRRPDRFVDSGYNIGVGKKRHSRKIKKPVLCIKYYVLWGEREFD